MQTMAGLVLRCCVALLLACVAIAAAAASPQSLNFDHLTAEQGLPDDVVMAMLQDERGFMWLGTQAGLARYDGRRMTVFRPQAGRSDGLSHAVVHALLPDGRGGMWIGTGGGLDRLDWNSGRISQHPMPEGHSPRERRLLALAQDGRGRVWLGTTGGLLRFDPVSGNYDRPLQTTAATRALLADGRGGVWAAVGHRALRVDAEGQVLQEVDASAAAPGRDTVRSSIRSLALDGTGRLWLGTQLGLQVWALDEDSPRLEPLAEQLPSGLGVLFAIRRDDRGAMWLGFTEGLVRFAAQDPAGAALAPPELFRHHPMLPHSLASNSVASLYQDRSGVLWVGSWGAGIGLTDLRGPAFTSYRHLPDQADSLSHTSVMAILPHSEERVWVGSYGGGLDLLHLPSGRAERVPPLQAGVRMLKALLAAADGELLLGGDDGLVRYDPRQRRHRRIELGNTTPGGGSISSLVRDGEVIWAGSATGLHRIAPDGRVQTFRAGGGAEGALAHDTVDCLLRDRGGRLWVGTKGGLHRWEPAGQRFERIARLEGSAQLGIQSMLEDGQGRRWVGTDLGLYELIESGSGWALKSWRDIAGMPQGWITAMQYADDGDLWLAGQQGLVRFSPQRRQARLYPNRASLLHGGFNFGAAARGGDGRLFFGNLGLLSFRPEQMHDDRGAPPVVLSDLLVFNRSLAEGHSGRQASGASAPASDATLGLADLGVPGPLHQARQVVLSHREAMVSFEFAALSYYKPEARRYAWQLEGFDQQWIQGKPGEAVATYTNLDPGRYRLLAKAAGPGGGWGETSFALDIEVLPPWWGSWWFRVATLTALALALALAYRLRLHTLHRARLRLEREVAQRTQEVVEQKLQLAHEKQSVEQQHEAAERARRQITLLSEIGRELTASLDAHDICQSLYRHVGQLMDATVFGVGLVHWDEGVIAFDYVRQQGQAFQPYRRHLDDLAQPATQCALHARELVLQEIDRDNRIADARPMSGSAGQRLVLADGRAPAPARSGLYVPMLVKGQVMGVISVLSERTNAFGDTDLDILRTLGAYAAVALDKAEAYLRLQQAQGRLVEQEKLAALGSLVAGVSHELNTPLGNALLVASTLNDQGRRFALRLDEGGLRRSELTDYSQRVLESSELLLRSLDTATTLVQGFKQLAVDQSSDQRREFLLAKVCEEVALTLAGLLKREEHELSLAVDESIRFDSYPGPLSQVLTNLIVNAQVHAFDGRRQGRIELQAQALGRDHVLISVSDNGRGISAQHLKHIFEPFFTTRLGQGGSGLGLHICYNIVHTLLGGQIRASSTPGQGTRFDIELPLQAPQPGGEALAESPPGGAAEGPWIEGAGV